MTGDPPLRRLKVLISAYACSPGRGSEAGTGWDCVQATAQFHETWVITSRINRAEVEKALEKDELPDLHFVYVDLPKWTRFWQVYYYLWQISAYFCARRLCRKVRIDVIHHVTFVKYWVPSFMSLLPVPFVWGPVGGGEAAPRAFWRDFSLRGRAYETLRDIGRWVGDHDPFVLLTARRCALALATTEETAARMRAIKTRNVRVYSAIGMTGHDLDRLTAIEACDSSIVRFISIGRLIHWKGFHLGIKAFARANLPGAEYWIVGDGAERRHLEALVAQLGIVDRVKLWGQLSRDETFRKLSECDIYVHPSLHDSGGLTCLEAMAAGRPVICLDLGGPTNQVTQETGIKVSAQDPEEAITDLAAAMVRLSNDPDLRHQLGFAGRNRVISEYLWSHKAKHYRTLYLEAIQLR